MVTAVVIDDEKNALEVLSMQIERYCPDVKILKLCQGGEEGVAAIKLYEPQLVFLDIEMPKINGFDVLDLTKDHHYNVIFTTAYDQFAIKAFKYSAVDYLLKPIDIEELKLAVSKIKKTHPDEFRSKLEILMSQLDLPVTSQKKIALPTGDGYEMVSISNIIRCESESNYTIVILSDKRKIMLSKTLKEVEHNLNHSQFFRVHNSHLVNTDHISKFYKSDGGYIIMSDGTSINIARAKKDAFFRLLQQGE